MTSMVLSGYFLICLTTGGLGNGHIKQFAIVRVDLLDQLVYVQFNVVIYVDFFLFSHLDLIIG